MKLSENFSLEEMVAPEFIERIGARSADFLHPELVPTLQKIRDKFGAIVVNGTFNGKVFTESGLRAPTTTTGARYSAHKFGTAADLKFYDTTPEEVQEYIIRHQSDFPNIKRMESAKVTISWLHIETTYKRVGNIYVFQP